MTLLAAQTDTIKKRMELTLKFNPNITTHGIGPENSVDGHDLPPVNEVKIVLAYLLARTPLKRDLNTTTYSWKHAVEDWAHFTLDMPNWYVSNQAFILGALVLGLNVKHIDGTPNGVLSVPRRFDAFNNFHAYNAVLEISNPVGDLIVSRNADFGGPLRSRG